MDTRRDANESPIVHAALAWAAEGYFKPNSPVREPAEEDLRLTDAHGKTWRVFDYEFIESFAWPVSFGRGEYRAFEPVSGGPIRTFPLLPGERQPEKSVTVLLAQLAASTVYIHRVEGRRS